MADFQNQNQNWSGQNPAIGTGEGEVPLAKPPIMDMTMRTMASDISSIKESGGGEPRAYVPREPVAPQAPAPAQQRPMNVPPFQPAPSIPPQGDMGAVRPLSAPQVSAPKSSNALFLIIVFTLVAIAIGAVGWFFIYPQISGSPQTTTEEPAVTTPTEQTGEQPTGEPAGIQENATTTTEVPTTVPPTITEPTPPGTSEGTPTLNTLPVVDTHVSLFKTPADFSSEATIASVTLEAVKGALQSSPVEVPVLKEIVFKNEAGKVYALSAVAPLFMPSVLTSGVVSQFASDASYFTYTTNEGAWPGIVLTLSSTDKARAQADIAKIESNNEYLSLFMTDVGTPTSWKDGKVGTAPARYISFSKQGVAFSYTWIGNTLVMSTSYAGAQEAVKRLGL